MRSRMATARRPSRARQAHDLNPLAVEPLWAWALARRPAATSRARSCATGRRGISAENSDTWYALGAFEFVRERYQRRTTTSAGRGRSTSTARPESRAAC
jgi:hypothetical protein